MSGSGFTTSTGPCDDQCWVDNQAPLPICLSCTHVDISQPASYLKIRQEQKQRKIWNVARASESEYLMNLQVQNVTGDSNNKPKAIYNFVNWNQSSDRAVPSVSTYHTTRQTTRHRPGGSGAGGVGVDIKHNSYARYLARKKSGNLKTKKSTPLPAPKKGNKQYSLGFINNCNC